jgi:hypothetical protein
MEPQRHPRHKRDWADRAAKRILDRVAPRMALGLGVIDIDEAAQIIRAEASSSVPTLFSGVSS